MLRFVYVEFNEQHNNCPSCRAECDPEPTTVAQTLIPEIGNLSDFLQQLGEQQRTAREDPDGGIARVLGGRPHREEREEFSMYS